MALGGVELMLPVPDADQRRRGVGDRQKQNGHEIEDEPMLRVFAWIVEKEREQDGHRDREIDFAERRPADG